MDSDERDDTAKSWRERWADAFTYVLDLLIELF